MCLQHGDPINKMRRVLWRGFLTTLMSSILLLMMALGIGRLMGGYTLSYVATPGRIRPNYEIYLVDIERRITFNLTHHPAFDQSPAWSPDGRAIVFQSDRDGSADLYLMSGFGHDVRRLTNDLAYDWSPQWSADGRAITFGSNRDGEGWLYLTDADGNNIRRLSEPPPGRDQAPVVSADGRWIAFTAYVEGNIEIFIRRRDEEASHARRVTFNSSNDYSPAWKP